MRALPPMPLRYLMLSVLFCLVNHLILTLNQIPKASAKFLTQNFPCLLMSILHRKGLEIISRSSVLKFHFYIAMGTLECEGKTGTFHGRCCLLKLPGLPVILVSPQITIKMQRMVVVNIS
jgi:hypothetical protein